MGNTLNGIPILEEDANTTQLLLGNILNTNRNSFTGITNSGLRSEFPQYERNWNNELIHSRYEQAKLEFQENQHKVNAEFDSNSIRPTVYIPKISWKKNPAHISWENNEFSVMKNGLSVIMFVRDKFDNKKGSKLKYSDFVELGKLALGDTILIQNLTEEMISQIADNLINYVFASDLINAKALKPIIEQSITQYYTKYRITEDNPSFWENLLAYLFQVLKPFLDLLREFIHLLLSKLAELLNKLKITDFKYWLPSHPKYINFFFGLLEKLPLNQLLENFKKPFVEVDNVISNFLGESHNELDAKSKAIEDNRSGIIKSISFYYNQIKGFFTTVYNALSSFFSGITKALRAANALFVGVYNGLIGFVADTIKGIADLFSEDGVTNFINGIKSLIDLFKEKGFFDTIATLLKTVVTSFTEKFNNLAGTYDLLKVLGEELTSILLGVAGMVAGGIGAIKKIKDFLQIFIKLIKNPKASLDNIKLLLKNGVTKLDDTINKIPGIGSKEGKPKSKKQTEVEKRAAERKEKREQSSKEKGSALLDWMSSRKIDELGGKILRQSQIRRLRGLLKQKGVSLIIEGDINKVIRLFKPIDDFKSFDELVLFMNTSKPPKVGTFHAGTKQLVLTKNCSELVAFHELAHLKHLETVGEAVYKTLNRFEKEMFVWKEILANKRKWSKLELGDSLRYINDIRTNPKYGNNLKPIKL